MNQGFFLFQQAIEKSGFPHIGKSDDGNLDRLFHGTRLSILDSGIRFLFGDNIINRLEWTGQVDMSSQGLFFSPIDEDKHLFYGL